MKKIEKLHLDREYRHLCKENEKLRMDIAVKSEKCQKLKIRHTILDDQRNILQVNLTLQDQKLDSILSAFRAKNDLEAHLNVSKIERFSLIHSIEKLIFRLKF